jgi:Fe2+ or Zn2+ uptake regulation protein
MVNGIFPTQEILRANLGNSIIYAMYAYHGGLPHVAAKMGYELTSFYKTTDGHYVKSSYEYILDEYLFSRGIPHEVDKLISEDVDDLDYRYDFKIDDHFIEIWGYEERENNSRCEKYKIKRIKKEDFYKKLGVSLISLDHLFFKKKSEEIEVELDKIFADLGYDVTKKEIEVLVNPNQMKHPKYWTVSKVEEELKEIINTLGNEFPTPKKLRELKRTDLLDAVKSRGGFEFFRKRLGYELHHKPDGYWNDSTIIPELEKIIEQIGHFPNYRELKALKRSDLIKAIAKNGGFVSYQEKILM